MGRTQHGNNNAYCQDSELSWINWELSPEARLLQQFAGELIRLRNAHPLFRRRTWFRGRALHDPALRDIAWLDSGGQEMTDAQWNHSFARCLGVFISGRGLMECDERGRPVEDDDLLLLLNAHDEPTAFTLPNGEGTSWAALVDTSTESGIPQDLVPRDSAVHEVKGRSVVLLARSRR